MTAFNIASEIVHIISILVLFLLIAQTFRQRKRIDKIIDTRVELSIPQMRAKFGFSGPHGYPGPVGPPGIKGDPGFSEMEIRIWSARIHMLHLLGMNKISESEYTRLYDMIDSPDRENLKVAEEVIKNLIRNG